MAGLLAGAVVGVALGVAIGGWQHRRQGHVRIQVTADHLRRGEANSYDSCPVGLALKEALGLETIEVNKRSIRVRPGGLILAPTPRLVRRFIQRLDRGDPVKPFSFWIPLTARRYAITWCAARRFERSLESLEQSALPPDADTKLRDVMRAALAGQLETLREELEGRRCL